MQNEPYCSIFMLINNGSGGGVGKQFIKQEIQKIEFNISITKPEESKLIHLYFYDLRTQRKKAFGLIKQTTKNKRKVLVIACGGDGTIMWVVQQLYNYYIDPMEVTLGVIPIGTGNDFSQYLGWGNKKTTLVNTEYKSLKKLIRKWLVADQQQLDIWNVKAQVFQHGYFQKVNKEKKNEVIEGKTFVRDFCNYFSFGIDGKIGYSFDSHRTNSRIGNLLMYGTLGFIKNSTKTKSVKELVQRMQIRPQFHHQYVSQEDSIISPKEHLSSPFQENENEKMDKVLLKEYTRTVVFNSSETSAESFLQQDYFNLLFLNINSYMAGIKDVWKKASEKQKNIKSQFKEQSSDDGKIQVLAFSSCIGLGLQKIIGGFATKIAQGQGPYFIEFKAYDKQEKHRTYIQVDGQYLRITHPKSLLISKSPLSANSKIKVLRRNIQKEKEKLID